ncbi:HAT dimerization [Mycena venus]|uniref:HAT dimerization n=1 Tax=Mycena venus TaxID=2733690 RepID=A0A8H7CY21_9AGAR|nr:HAT dimerization [Mycena venus]
MSHSALGCAQKQDGSLRDASEIQFYNDVDDEHPISGPSAPDTAASTRQLAPIFTRGKPVGIVAGSHRPSPRRSSRPSKPSARAIDPNNAEVPTGSTKRKASANAPVPALRKAAEAPEVSPPSATPVPESTAFQHYGSSFLLDAVKLAQKTEQVVANPRDELERYLSTHLEPAQNILHWWGHDTAYPTLRQMARDYLAIQGSATPAERAFSSGSLTGTRLRNRLSIELFEALQLPKSAYRNGHISASDSAGKRMDALISEVVEQGFEEDDFDDEDDDSLYF